MTPHLTPSTFSALTLIITLSLTTTPTHAQLLDRIFGKSERSTPGQTHYTNPQQTPPPHQQHFPSNQQPPSLYDGNWQQPPQPIQPYAAPPQTAYAPTQTQNIPAGTPMILEFTSLQCPDSARFANGLKNTIFQRYIHTGRARFEFRDFPLPKHDQSRPAAAAARCAGQHADQMRSLIMANQGQMSPATYARLARQLGINPAQFTACIRDGHTMREVMSDKALGDSFGVTGTPTLVLGIADGNGNIQHRANVIAYNPPDQVLAEIDQFLATVETGAQPGQPQPDSRQLTPTFPSNPDPASNQFPQPSHPQTQPYQNPAPAHYQQPAAQQQSLQHPIQQIPYNLSARHQPTAQTIVYGDSLPPLR